MSCPSKQVTFEMEMALISLSVFGVWGGSFRETAGDLPNIIAGRRNEFPVNSRPSSHRSRAELPAANHSSL